MLNSDLGTFKTHFQKQLNLSIFGAKAFYSIIMNKTLEAYVIKAAKGEAKNQLKELEVNFLSLEYFEKTPSNEKELVAAFQQMAEQKDDLWWHCWEGVEEVIPEMLEDHENRTIVGKEAKLLISKTYNQSILEGLRKHFGLKK
ncbi:MAG: hypothetical protein H7259_10655 [Cytophagales bacterium]|nr:hypothetical protein [Cytophaga sp.]